MNGKVAVVIDTNVPIVANEKHNEASPDCVIACLDALKLAREQQIVLLDDGLHILNEYRGKLSLSGQPGAGDLFMKWVWNNQANEEFCKQVSITPIGGNHGDFKEFPRDPRLKRFDRNDRKFVAVALASKRNPEIINASDTDWWIHKVALEDHGLRLSFLCPELMT